VRAARGQTRDAATDIDNREDEGGDTAGKPKIQARSTGATPYRSCGQQETNHHHHYHWKQHGGRKRALASARPG